jgi:hypothetical protein
MPAGPPGRAAPPRARHTRLHTERKKLRTLRLVDKPASRETASPHDNPQSTVRSKPLGLKETPSMVFARPAEKAVA